MTFCSWTINGSAFSSLTLQVTVSPPLLSPPCSKLHLLAKPRTPLILPKFLPRSITHSAANSSLILSPPLTFSSISPPNVSAIPAPVIRRSFLLTVRAAPPAPSSKTVFSSACSRERNMRPSKFLSNPAAAVAHELLQEISRWSARPSGQSQEDDMTLLVFDYQSSS